MAMVNDKTQCAICNKHTITYTCRGCSKEFCRIHLTEHQVTLQEELGCISNDCNQFKEDLNQQKYNSCYSLLMNQIDQWEINSFELIQQKAGECRKTLIQIRNEVKNPSKFYLKEENSERFINKISIEISKKFNFNKWKQHAVTVAGINNQEEISIDKKKNNFIPEWINHHVFQWKSKKNQEKIVIDENRQGNRIDQSNLPVDVIIDEQNNSVIIADTGNKRVIRWSLNPSQQEILIDDVECSGLTIDKYGFLYVCDFEKHEVRRWNIEKDKEGIVVAGGNGKGNQLREPSFIFVDNEQSIYISDTGNHRRR